MTSPAVENSNKVGDINVQVKKVEDNVTTKSVRASTRRPGSVAEVYARRGYKPLCLGNSAHDWAIILTCFAVLYVTVGIFFWLLYLAVSDTSESQTTLWLFFGVFAIFVGFLGLTIYTGQLEQKIIQKKLAEEKNPSGEKAV